MSNGVSNITASLTYYYYYGSPYYYYYFSATVNGLSPPTHIVNGNGAFGTTISMPANITLTTGAYSGSITVYANNINELGVYYPYTLTTTMNVSSSCSVSSSGATFGSINGGSQATIAGTVCQLVLMVQLTHYLLMAEIQRIFQQEL